MQDKELVEKIYKTTLQNIDRATIQKLIIKLWYANQRDFSKNIALVSKYEKKKLILFSKKNIAEVKAELNKH